VAGLLCSAAGALAEADLTRVSIVVFGPPSRGAFLPPVIKARALDQAHGLDATFEQRTPDAYAAQFNSGEFKVGGSAALLTVGLAEARGVEATYLFNLFDYWGAVVTSRDEIKTLADLQGKDLAAATGTTNYQMFRWLAKQQGVDLSGVSAINTAPLGLVGYAMADRAVPPCNCGSPPSPCSRRKTRPFPRWI
jgi:ABC-type nitrate/sulfonate/bicarbonate transport system substrate-binding protein